MWQALATVPIPVSMPGFYSCCSTPLLAAFAPISAVLLWPSAMQPPNQLGRLLQCVDTPASWPSSVCSPPLLTTSLHSSHQASQPNCPWWGQSGQRELLVVSCGPYRVLCSLADHLLVHSAGQPPISLCVHFAVLCRLLLCSSGVPLSV